MIMSISIIMIINYRDNYYYEATSDRKVHESPNPRFLISASITKCLILDPKTKQVWWIAGAAEIKKRAKVLIQELSGPGVL